MNMTLEKKYIPLANFFATSTNPAFTLHFTEIEKIMGQNLPNSAYLSRSWWKKQKAPAKHFQAWSDAGYAVKHVELNQYVVFEKMDRSNENAEGKAQEDTLLIRPAEHGDARYLAALKKRTENESRFLLYGKEERTLSTQKARKQIIEWKKSGHSVYFLAILNGQHVGYLSVEGNDAKRAAHRAELSLALQADSQNKGITSSLLQKAEEWAFAQSVSRLEITVVEADVPVLKILQQHGYESEGIRRKAMMIDGKPFDEVYMAKILA